MQIQIILQFYFDYIRTENYTNNLTDNFNQQESLSTELSDPQHARLPLISISRSTKRLVLVVGRFPSPSEHRDVFHTLTDSYRAEQGNSHFS